MTARAFSDALGPLALHLARAAGWRDGTWRAAVSREQDLTWTQREGLREALTAHIKEAQEVRRALKGRHR